MAEEQEAIKEFQETAANYSSPDFDGDELTQCGEKLLEMLASKKFAKQIREATQDSDEANSFVSVYHANEDDLHMAIVKAYLENGINPDVQECEGYTALAHAIANKLNKLARFLMDHGANINHFNHTRGGSGTPIMFAIDEDNVEIVDLLLQRGADVTRTAFDEEDDEKETVLMIACRGWRTSCDCVTLLLEHGVDVNAKNKNEETALMFACTKSKPDAAIVRLLLDFGADIHFKNNKGMTALDLAKNEEVKELLGNHEKANYVLK